MVTNLLKHYRKHTVVDLAKQFKISNVMAQPRIEKIVVSMAIGSWIQRNGKDYSELQRNMDQITGQKSYLNLAVKSVSNFKLREGMPVGLTTTLRGKKAYDFLDRLINVNLPRVRDFRGTSLRFDKNGNYSLGIRDYSIFAELDHDSVNKTAGMGVTIVIAQSDPDKSRALLQNFGFPFRK